MCQMTIRIDLGEQTVPAAVGACLTKKVTCEERVVREDTVSHADTQGEVSEAEKTAMPRVSGTSGSCMFKQ